MARYSALLISPYPELVDVAETVAGEFPELEVTVHQGDLSAGLQAAIGNMDESYDVVISRGGTAQILEDELSLPVIEIAVSPSDLYEALALHNPRGGRTAVVGFSNALEAVRQVADFSDFDLDVYDVNFEDELPLVLEDVVAGGYDVVLCDTFSQSACAARGLDAHLLLSGEQSVADALRRAVTFCEQTSELLAKNRMLWYLIRNQPARSAILSPAGRIVFSNLTDEKGELIAFMREHLAGPAEERLSLRRGGRSYRVTKSSMADGGQRYVLFTVMASGVTARESLIGLGRLNRDEAEHSYRESTFRTVNGEAGLAPAIAHAARSGRPVMLEGEVGTGKAQIALLLYLRGGWSTRPLNVVDCPLLTERSWEHLMESTSSPLYGSGETIWLKAVHALSPEGARRLVGVMSHTGVCDRNHVIVSANDDPGATESPVVSLFVEYLRCYVLTAPPLRRRPTIRQAVSLFVDNEARLTGSRPPFVSDEAMEVLASYPWPNNYIELRQVLQRAIAAAEDGTIRARDVREALDRDRTTRFSSLDTPSEESSIDLLRPLRDIERDVVRMVVERYGGNQTKAARTLDVSRTTVWRMLRDDGEGDGGA